MTITTQRPADTLGDTAALQAAGGVSSLQAMLQHFRMLEPVFDSMPDIVFFVKDADARYALCTPEQLSRVDSLRALERARQTHGPS